MKPGPEIRTVNEPAREIDVCRQADVVVVGGGPGGIGAALSAARNGADTVLVERYGHLGGMSTGGLVTIIPNLSNIKGEQQIAGICQELVDRLDSRDAVSYPKQGDWGSTDPALVDHYIKSNLFMFYIRNDQSIGQKRVLYTALVDPEILKCELNNMMEEAGVKMYLHSWGVRPILDGNTVKGVFIESKSGRQAILGKVVIDSTGDGDLLQPAGAECDTRMLPNLRIAKLALSFWIGNIDMHKAEEFRFSQPQKYSELMQELVKLGGIPSYMKDILRYHDGVVWFHPFYPCMNQSDVGELNRVEFAGRKKMMTTYNYFKKHVPGFENSFIMISAPQIGTQGGQRVIGEYVLTERDMVSDEVFYDTIAVFANNDNGEMSIVHPNVCIPYRSLVPRDINGMLVACRAFSSEYGFNEYFNLIPHCIAFGQAAGTAAAIAVRAGIEPRKVDYRTLQDNLLSQGVKLPEGVKAKP